MNRRVQAAVVMVAVLLIVGAWLEPTQTVLGRLSGEPFFAGRPLRYWAAKLSGPPGEHAQALAALGAGDQASATPLLAALYRSSGGTDGAQLRWTALELLIGHAPLDAPGQELLLEALHDADEHVQSVAAAALHKGGVTADLGVPALTPLLTGPHAVVAARALSEYRGAAAPALPALVALLHDKSRSVEARWNAARTIGKIGPDAVSVVPELIEELDDPEDTIREHAAEAIGDIGPVAAELGVPALQSVLNDPYVKVRRDAVRSLGYIGPTAAGVIEDVLPLLQDPEEIVRTAARNAVQAIAPERLPAAEPAQIPPGSK